VGKSTHDEQRHAEQQREVLALTGEVYGGSHYKSATYGKYATAQGTCSQAPLKHRLCRLLKGHGRAAGDEGNSQTANDISYEDEKQLSHLTATDETCSASIELQPVVNDREEAEGEEHRTHDALLGQIAKAGDADAYAS
jgi:hypothetical protein